MQQAADRKHRSSATTMRNETINGSGELSLKSNAIVHKRRQHLLFLEEVERFDEIENEGGILDEDIEDTETNVVDNDKNKTETNKNTVDGTDKKDNNMNLGNDGVKDETPVEEEDFGTNDSNNNDSESSDGTGNSYENENDEDEIKDTGNKDGASNDYHEEDTGKNIDIQTHMSF